MCQQGIHHGINVVVGHHFSMVRHAPLVFENVRSENTLEVGSVHYETVDVQCRLCNVDGYCSQQLK